MSASNSKLKKVCTSIQLTLVFITVICFVFCYLFVILTCFFTFDGNATFRDRSLKNFQVVDSGIIPSAALIVEENNYFKKKNSLRCNESNAYPKEQSYSRSNSDLRRKLPEVLIIGVKKGGTRALLEFLRIHPDIRASGRETHFFDKNFKKGLEWYRSLMPLSVKNQLTMEKTPSYFVTDSVPHRVHRMSPETRLLLVVRNPVTRAISDYTQSISKSANPNISFTDFAFRNSSGKINRSWHALRVGLYAMHLSKWLEYFPLKNFHFVDGEKLKLNPATELSKVEDFLNITNVISPEHFFIDKIKGFPCLKKWRRSSRPHCLGKTKGRTHPSISNKVIRRLKHFYKPYNKKFYEITDINFNWD